MHQYHQPPQLPARLLLIGSRLRIGWFRMDVSPDWFVSLGLTAVVLVAVSVTLGLLHQSTASLTQHETVIDGFLVLLTSSALGALWLTVLGDPGLVTALPDGVNPAEVVEVKELLQRPELSDVDACACRVCGVLVRGFDHHCGIIGACIGERNMWSFVLFLSSTTFLCLTGFMVNAMMLYASFPSRVTELEHLKVLATLKIAAGAACSLVCVYGGSYCCILSIVYTSYICEGQDSWGKRWHHRFDGRSKCRRWTESIRWAKQWQSSFTVRQDMLLSLDTRSLPV